MDAFSGPGHRLRTALRRSDDQPDADAVRHTWALKDVSFEVERGQVVGIIGRNGAGKTTLLKVLSRITEPTAGSVDIYGRVGSLLEVGTGFHPELTGRENVYLNGSILGMRSAAVRRGFDEIVSFADVEEFIDTPVKHYSTGMHMRLAFAVAAHLEPEILVVDEVLAVGDVAFQKKCLRKMGELSVEGRTVLLVSHQMNQIRRLSNTCIWLDKGRIQEIGSPAEVVGRYEAAVTSPASTGLRDDLADYAAGRFVRWELVEPRADPPNVLPTQGPVLVRFLLRVQRLIRRGVHGIALLRSDGQNMWGSAVTALQLEPGLHELCHTVPLLPLQPGAYYWQVSVSNDEGMIDLWDALPELVIATPPLTHFRDQYAGVLNIASEFSLRQVSSE
jgi:lipopolysaccharide transport system ATP-binding protein